MVEYRLAKARVAGSNPVSCFFLYPKTENAVFIEVLEIFCFSFIAFCLFASMIKEEVELCVGGSLFDCRT